MKLSFYTIFLIFAVSLVLSSCKTNQDHAMKDYYRNANKYTAMENKLLDNNGILLSSTPAKKNKKSTYNNTSEEAYSGIVQSKSNEYKVIYDDSEIANGDVYREAAAHRQKLMKEANKNCNCDSIKTSATTTDIAYTTNKKVQPRTPDIFAHLLDADNNPIREVGISYLNESDKSLLKPYSVIIASLAREEGVARLKKAFSTSDEQLFFVRNENGMYYAIIGSYHTGYEAKQKIKGVQKEYSGVYSTEQLFGKYGITFSDLWILKK